MSLFNQKLCRERIARFEFPTREKAAQIEKIIADWQHALKDSDLSKTKEISVQGGFLTKFFEEVLGYSSRFAGKDEWNLNQHPTSEVDAQVPDGSLGFFTNAGERITKAVIELKDAKTLLDKKQTSRDKKYTPIEQAYLYATKFDGCNWIIVSNFREIRLYHKSRTQDFFEKFDVLELHKTEEFKRFYYFLCKQNLISHSKTSIIDDLANDSTKEDEDITLKFYQDYKNVRLNLFHHLVDQNPEIEKTLLLEKAQKIIDRLIFILFCEDTGNLLPRNLAKDTYELGIRSRERSDQRVWREFKNLFMDIDLGRSDIDPEINMYNGGLFSQDDVLDSLVIKDTIWKQIVSLNKYNFESGLNVNILGHIFEQSISDIENLKAELLGRETDSTTPRRKKEGIFYTPEFITKYLVENVVERFLTEHPDKLGTIKILDPACGSGAFLNQAHSFLMKEYNIRNEQKLLEKTGKGIQQLDFSDINLAESNRSILLNNLFGVDLNQESVEITKLSLWLKTARASEPLQNLDRNIKCGNSIVDDPMFTGARAFIWYNEFNPILDSGGFDVIIGNPPYGYREIPDDKLKNFYVQNFVTHESNFEFYRFFLEASMKLIRLGGILGFIIPNTFLTSKSFTKLRNFLLNFQIEEIVDLGLKVFEGVVVENIILIVRKQNPSQETKIKIDRIHNGNIVPTNEYSVNQNEWRKNENALFTIYLNRENKNVIDKMENNSIKLKQIAYCTVGINTGYIKSKLIADTQIDGRYHKMLNGRDIGRYSVRWEGEWIMYDKEFVKNFGDKGRSLPPEYIFSENKILLQRTRRGLKRKLVAFLDEKQFYNLNRLSNIVITNKEYNIYYILGLLNSELLDFYFNKKFAEYEVKPSHLNELPIFKASEEQQEIIAIKAKSIQELIKELDKETKNSLIVISEEYKSIDITSKLKKFYLLGWNEFIEELEKQKIKLNLTQKDELNVWFRSKQIVTTKLNETIEKLNKEINSYVYKLYNLNDSEIKLIEKDLLA